MNGSHACWLRCRQTRAGRIDPEEQTRKTEGRKLDKGTKRESCTGAARRSRCGSPTAEHGGCLRRAGADIRNCSTATILALAIIERVSLREVACRDERAWSL